MQKNKQLLYILGAIAFVIFCVWFFEGRTIYAKVGDFKIYKKDIEYRNNLIRMNYPEEKGDYGYKQLEKSYINYQVMRNHGYKEIERRLENEVDRIEKNTKMPELLKKIKEEIFKGDMSAYKRAFVIPAAVDEEVFFGFYATQEKLHESSQKLAQDILEQLKSNPTALKKISHDMKFDYILYQISKDDIVLVNPETMKPVSNLHSRENFKGKPKEKIKSQESDAVVGDEGINPRAELAHYWNNVILKETRSGDPISQPISLNDQWYVGRVLKSDKQNKIVELVSIPKKSYSEILEAEKEHIPIRKGFFLF